MRLTRGQGMKGAKEQGDRRKDDFNPGVFGTIVNAKY